MDAVPIVGADQSVFWRRCGGLPSNVLRQCSPAPGIGALGRMRKRSSDGVYARGEHHSPATRDHADHKAKWNDWQDMSTIPTEHCGTERGRLAPTQVLCRALMHRLLGIQLHELHGRLICDDMVWSATDAIDEGRIDRKTQAPLENEK